MKCPYCTSEIGDEALACPHCTRDLYLFKPLLAKIEALEQKLREMEARVAATADVETATPESEVLPIRSHPYAEAALNWIMPLLLLVAAHALIVVVYDLNTLYLRAVSLLIPLPFGIALMARHDRHFGGWSAAAVAMALFAVLGMSWATSLVDHTAVLPADRRELREFVEYAASIAGAYLAGMVVGRMLWRRRRVTAQVEKARGLVLKVAALISNGQANAEKLQATVKKLQDLGSSLTAAGATAASAYVGLKGFIGS